MISFIESADYFIGPKDSLCADGMDLDLSKCKKAAEKLDIEFKGEEEEQSYPGGCYIHDGSEVYFNKNWQGTSDDYSKPICGQGKYDKYFTKILEL